VTPAAVAAMVAPPLPVMACWHSLLPRRVLAPVSVRAPPPAPAHGGRRSLLVPALVAVVGAACEQ